MDGSPRSPSSTYESRQLRAAVGAPVLGAPVLGAPVRGVAADNAAVRSEAVARRLTGDHDRITPDANDVMVGRLFAAGLDLHVALGLIGDHRAVGTIHHAIGGLDQAIRELRDTAYYLGPHDHHVPR